MELVYVDGEMKELALESTYEVHIARLCFRARARTIQQVEPLANLQPRMATEGTPEQQAVRQEFSACNALGTVLHNRGVTFFIVRGDVQQLYDALQRELPAYTSSATRPIPRAMSNPTTTEMSEREFGMYAGNVSAYTMSGGSLQPPQAT